MKSRVKMLDVIGLDVEKAVKALEDNKIKYNKDYNYKYSLFKKKGTVIKTVPSVGDTINQKKEVELYVSKFMLAPIFLLLLAIFIPTLLYLNGGLSRFRFDNGDAPYITTTKEGWVQSNVVYVSKDSTLENIKHYEYCIRQDEKVTSCEWNKTDTKNVEITTTGIYNLWFRAVNDKMSSNVSNMVTVYIDNDAPVINNISYEYVDKVLHINLGLDDNTSKVSYVEYKVDDGEYQKVDDFNNGINIGDLDEGNHTICIKVYDEALNYVETCINISIPVEDGIDKITPPIINLDKIPLTIEYLDDYELPSYVWYPNENGKTTCTVNGNEYTNTKDLPLGSNTIKCNATDINGLTSNVEKTIMVKYQSEDPEGQDADSGWIWLTLFYPDNSTEWEYEVRNPKVIRTYKTGWQSYTGPILVHVDDVRNVYIRYKLNGVQHIETPNGKNLVSIEPDSKAVRKNDKTKVTIYYNENAKQKLYKLNDGPWKPYTEPFEVEADTTIYAKVVVRTPVYDNNGDLLTNKVSTDLDSLYISEYIPGDGSGNNNPDDDNPGGGSGSGGSGSGGSGSGGESSGGDNGGSGSGSGAGSGSGGGYSNGPLGPGYYSEPEDDTNKEQIEGPTIRSYPSNILVDKVRVTITTEYEARKIMYSINGSQYQEYTEPLIIDYNCTIKAYYIRDEDGLRSSIKSHRIYEVKNEKLPYVYISANPDTLNEVQNKSTVTITSKSADKLEYSLDGIIFVPYVKSFEVTHTCTVYARATNQYGETEESYTINLKSAPRKKIKLNVKITGNPANTFSQKVNQIDVSIDYDSRAEKRYYKLGDDGELKEYTGPFKINENTTVYAYAVSSVGLGSTSRMFDYTVQGIADPVINIDPETGSQQTKVSIDYDINATITQVKYGNTGWIDYTGSFYVNENTTIYARSYNADNQMSQSLRKIRNIIAVPSYRLLDKGDYIILYLNYPEDSKPELREYKWKVNGTWKTYNTQGILLIKPETNIDKGDEGYRVLDENGKEVVFKDHYYILETGIDEISEYLFMRWSDDIHSGPSFVTSTDDMAASVDVGIVYRDYDVMKYYRIVDSNGPSEWMPYDGMITINEPNTSIYAKSVSSEGEWSDVSHITINNIDNEDPVIKVTGEFEKPVDEINLKVLFSDNNKVELGAWERGNQELSYFWEAGEYVDPSNEVTINITENGYYTFYAMDEVGRETIKVIKVENIGKDPRISIDTTDWTLTKKATIKYHEGLTNQYSLDNGATWNTYSGPITLNEQKIIIARSLENNKVVGSRTFTVHKIDTTVPSVNITLDSEVLLNSDHPLPTNYLVNPKLSGGEVKCVDEKNRELNNTSSLGTGEHTVTCTVTTGAGKKATATKTFTVVRNLYSVDFNCTGDVQEWTAPVNGLYRFTTYGAQGGSLDNAEGGKGGFASGEISLYEGNKFYIYVGCVGSENAPGYNGGGSENANGASGGGATHIATSNLGELYNYENNKEDIIIVAGAGGGAGSMNGGNGGNNPTSGLGIYGTEALPGSLTLGGLGGDNAGDGSFGKGGSIYSEYTDHLAGAGGAGFYGGGAGGFGSPLNASEDGFGGAGGSNYVSTRLSNVKQDTGVKYDDGYAQVTLLDQYEKETPTLRLNKNHLDIDTEMVDVINEFNYDGDGELTVTSSDPDVVTVTLDEDDNIVLNPGTKVGDATITVKSSKAIIYKAGETTFTVNNKKSPFFNLTLDENNSGTNINIYNYEYVGPGSISLTTSNASNGTIRLVENTSTTDANGLRHSSGKITVTTSGLGELTATIRITGDANYREKTFIKRYTFTDPTVVVSSNDTAFQSALTEWGTITTATGSDNHNWYGTNSKTDTKIVNASAGDYVIIETINTPEWTGYYYQYKDAETGKYVIPQYKYTELDFDMTSSDSDDDAMGAMIRFNPNGFDSTTGTNNGKFTGYFLLMDNHANSGTGGSGNGGSSGYNNGNSNGIWSSNGVSSFSTACSSWSGTGTCKALTTNRYYWWTRNVWQHYKFIADGSSLKVYRWTYRADGNYSTSSGATLLYSATNSTYETGTYGFWTESQANAQFKNFKAITRDIDGYKITQYDL